MDNITIRTVPSFLRIVPFAKKKLAFAIAPYIFLPDHQYEDYMSGNPSPTTLGTIAHETVHIKREREQGLVRYGFKYLFSRSFRFEEELHAIAAQMKVYKDYGLVFDISKRAKMLSGPIYVYCVSYNEAKQRLEDIWNKQ